VKLFVYDLLSLQEHYQGSTSVLDHYSLA